jgi:hypothetical protein
MLEVFFWKDQKNKLYEYIKISTKKMNAIVLICAVVTFDKSDLKDSLF